MTPHFIGVSGLPRAGSTLLCQLLAQHPDLHCEGNTSPLATTLLAMRRELSNSTAMLSQLDNTFAASYGRLEAGMRGFLRGWYADCGKLGVVDKSRAWLQHVELLLALAPEAKLVICLRELGQVYGSIESQHQRTILLDFIDQLADYDRMGRADMLFGADRTVGAPLAALAAVPDLPESVRQRLYFVRFEDLVAQPAACMAHLYAWLGLAPYALDPAQLKTGIRESDSHYHMKYLHRQANQVGMPARHVIPPRIQGRIEAACGWFYQQYYPKN